MELPKENCISESIVRELHNHGHMGPEYVLPELRKIYWIMQVNTFQEKVEIARISGP